MFRSILAKPGVNILPNLLSLVTLQVVTATTYGATIENKVVSMTKPFFQSVYITCVLYISLIIKHYSAKPLRILLQWIIVYACKLSDNFMSKWSFNTLKQVKMICICIFYHFILLYRYASICVVSTKARTTMHIIELVYTGILRLHSEKENIAYIHTHKYIS